MKRAADHKPAAPILTDPPNHEKEHPHDYQGSRFRASGSATYCYCVGEMMTQPTNPFERIWALGYPRIVPVIPPTAEISEGSSLFKRVGTKQDARGKLPGVRGRDGKWFSWNWTEGETDPSDFARWQDMGAGVGIVTGGGLIAIDADTLNAEFAEIIRDTIKERLGGDLPIRVGQYPKAVYVARVSAPFTYSRIEFGPRDENGNAERVEVLSDLKFFVAEGAHKKTGKPYTWPRPLKPFDEIPVFTPEQITEMLQALSVALPQSSKVVTEGAGNDVPQAALRGDVKQIRKAVEATPNSSAHFPTRESYRDFGYAIKAALPDDPEDAFDIYADWCAKWEDGDNDPGVVESDWRRMKPPFRRGAPWVYEMAEKLSGGGFSKADAFFEPIEDSAPSPFDVQATAEREVSKAQDIYPLLRIEDLISRPPPTFLVDRHIPDVSMGILYSDPGVGKSFLALDLALTIAHGDQDWHGDAVHAPDDAMVLYLAAEGSFDLANRVKAWHKARGRSNFPKNFLVLEQTINFMHPEDIEKLTRTIDSVGAKLALTVVDTVSRMIPGAEENGQADMTLFIGACGLVRERYRCAVLGVHHAGKSGTLRGSTVLSGAADFIMRLDRKKGATVGTMTMEKQKAAPDGWNYQILFERVSLDEGQSSLVPSRAASVVGPGAELSEASLDMILDAMRCAWDAGEPWTDTPQAKERYAVRRMIEDFNMKGDDAEQTLKVLRMSRRIGLELRDRKRHKSGFKVNEGGDNLSADEAETGVFG